MPPGFELTDGNRCELHTLYDNYDSLRDAGVGFTEVQSLEHVLDSPQAHQPGKLRDVIRAEDPGSRAA